jgi:peptidoglycan hydrolase CwlO-like protein
VAEAREELAKSKVKQTWMQEEVAALEKQLEERVAVLEKQLEELNKVFMCVASVSV